jgi:hypothetical protein
MAEVTFYNRLEPRPRDNDFSHTLAAHIRDPLWFLSRQWQIGEFNGEDTGSLAFVHYGGRTARMPRWLRGSEELTIDQGAPLEPQTLREPFEPDLGLQVELGHDFEDLLIEEVGGEAGANTLIMAFHETGDFELDEPDDSLLNPVDPATRRFLSVHSGQVLNGYSLYQLGQAIASGTQTVPADVTTVPSEVAQVEGALERLLARVADIFGDLGTSDPATWKPARLEYRLQVVGANPSGSGNATLDAYPTSDGEYEWFSFDVASKNPAASEAAPEPVDFFMIPARVQFDGMPATRFWNFEENKLALPDIQAEGLDDLLKLLLADFMLVHSNDWYVLPYQQAVGTLAKTDFIVVHDVFGKLTLVERAEKGKTTLGSDRWTMFSISDRSGSPESLADYFVLPPTSGPAMQVGAVLEDVRFGRDEMANMAFGIERVTTSLIGEQRSGRERDAEIAARLDLPAPAPTDRDYPLRYDIQSEVPANWIPLFPVHPTANNPSIALEVGAAVKATGPGTTAPVPALSKILTPEGVGDDYRIEEEEIPRSGLRVERLVFRTRWIDGSNHIWVQRRRRVGAGESQSGLQFDQALPNDG